MSVWAWEIATNSAEVHDLLCSSDAVHATPDAPAPLRRLETTAMHVREGATHLLRRDRALVAMFTLTWKPRFAVESVDFPHAWAPIYLSRLAVDPYRLADLSLTGAQTLRRVVEVARDRRADAVRSEANPDLARSYELLHAFGFKVYGSDSGPSRRAWLQLSLA